MKNNWKEKLKELLIKQGLSPDDPEDEASQQIWCEQENFISSLLSSQLKEVLGVIESKKIQPEYVGRDDVDISYFVNFALDKVKAEVAQLAEGEKEI